MGRYRRRNDQDEADPNKLKNGDISNPPTNTTKRIDNGENVSDERRNKFVKKKKCSQSFSPHEKDQIEAYLVHYRDGVKRACFPPPGASASGGEVTGPDEETIRISNKKAWHFENEGVIIGGHKFPALEPELLLRPYLELPNTMTNKHRKCIYEACIHAGLFHTGAGKKISNTRHAIVSVHPDGFDYAQDLQMPPTLPVRSCKSWFYRNDLRLESLSSSPLSSRPSSPLGCHFMSRQIGHDATVKARDTIQELANYPRLCLREIDALAINKYIQTPTHEPKAPLASLASDGDDKIPILNGGHDGGRRLHAKNRTVYVDTSTKMKECALTLLRSVHDHTLTELAFDIEAYNQSKYQQVTCLIQLCTNTGLEYMIDVFAKDETEDNDQDDIGGVDGGCSVWDNVSLLRPIFANPSVVKIGQGITGIDIPCLHKDFGIFVVNAFDTFEAAKVLNLKGHLGLAKLCNYYGLVDNDCDEERTYLRLKEKYQNADWRVRPLEKDMIEYGLRDVRYLVQLRRSLINDLVRAGKTNEKLSTTITDSPTTTEEIDIGAQMMRFYDDDDDDGYFPNTEEVKDEIDTGTQVKRSEGDDDDDDDGFYPANTDEIKEEIDVGAQVTKGEKDAVAQVLRSDVDGKDDDDGYFTPEDKSEKSDDEDFNDPMEGEVNDRGETSETIPSQFFTPNPTSKVHPSSTFALGVHDPEDKSEKSDNEDFNDPMEGEVNNRGETSETIPSQFFTPDPTSKVHPSSTFALGVHENLERVLSLSQERCLGFWTKKAEPTGKNEMLTKLIARADRLTCGNTRSTNKRIWTQSDMTLYSELVEWRDEVAKKEGVMPTMVCSLDLLVLMAYKRPRCRIGLKRLIYYIPELLQEGCEPDYLDDAFSIMFLASDNSFAVGDRGNDFASVAIEEDGKLYADRTPIVISSKRDNCEGPHVRKENEEDDDHSHKMDKCTTRLLRFPSDYKSRMRYLKWATLATAVVTFWIGALSRRRR